MPLIYPNFSSRYQSMIWLVFTFTFLEGELMCYFGILAYFSPWKPSHLCDRSSGTVDHSIL